MKNARLVSLGVFFLLLFTGFLHGQFTYLCIVKCRNLDPKEVYEYPNAGGCFIFDAKYGRQMYTVNPTGGFAKYTGEFVERFQMETCSRVCTLYYPGSGTPDDNTIPHPSLGQVAIGVNPSNESVTTIGRLCSPTP